MTRRIPLARPDITDTEIALVNEVLNTRYLSMGPKIQEFERMTAAFVGVEHAVAVNSGTSALHLLMRSIGIEPGDEVITSPYSFISSSNCILFERGVPVFADIDARTFNLDPALITELITPRTKAILPVHIFGQPCDMDPIMRIAAEHDLEVIEDSCEAIGAEYHGTPVGTIGRAGTFAYYPNKQMTTGEGGMIVTRDAEVARLCRSMRNQGRGEGDTWLEHERLGYNYRMDELSAALGVAQMGRLEGMLTAREQVARTYSELLEEVPGVTPPYTAPGMKVSWFVYVVRLDGHLDRSRVAQDLEERGIASRPYFAPLHTQPFYRKHLGTKEGDFPICEAVGAATLALPFHNHLPEEDIGYVVESLAAAIKTQEG